MFNRTLLSAVILVTCSSMVACVTKNRDDDFASSKNHLSQKVMIDANRDSRPPVLNQIQRFGDDSDTTGRMDLRRALELLDEEAWQPVSYSITNAYDKGNPKSPFHDKSDFKSFYYPPTYEGVDNWVLEKGADVNASIEFWLAMDAINRLERKEFEHDKMLARIGGVRPPKNYYGRRIRPGTPTYADTPAELENLLTDLLAYGVDRKTAMVVSHVCLNSAFVKTMREHEKEYFRVNEENVIQYGGFSETEKTIRYKKKLIGDYYLGYTGPLQGHNTKACDELRLAITKDDKSPFWGDLLETKGIQKIGTKVPNQVITTVQIDNPSLDVGLWQHMMSKDLYKGLGRVREEGLFSGLLYPERAKIVMIGTHRAGKDVGASRLSWDNAFNGFNPLDDARRAAYWMGDTMFSWYYDRESPQSHRFRQALSAQRGNFSHMDGRDKYAFAGCKLDPTLVSYQGNNVREFRKYYQCKMGRAMGYGLFSGMRTEFNHVAAHRTPTLHEYQAVFEFIGLSTDLRINNKCKNAEFKGLCENNKRALLQEEIEARQAASYFTFEDAVSYTQISEEGRIEGVVLVSGFKFIYDLTDIANWYQAYNPHKRGDWVESNLSNRFEYANSLGYSDDRYQSSNSHDGVSIALQE